LPGHLAEFSVESAGIWAVVREPLRLAQQGRGQPGPRIGERRVLIEQRSAATFATGIVSSPAPSLDSISLAMRSCTVNMLAILSSITASHSASPAALSNCNLIRIVSPLLLTEPDSTAPTLSLSAMPTVPSPSSAPERALSWPITSMERDFISRLLVQETVVDA
jgi:hypothetical protein